MLERTFCHIPGVSVRFEKMLWELGIHSWDCFMGSTDVPASAAKLRLISEQIRHSVERVKVRDPSFFFRKLPSRHHWRLFPSFRQSVAYLDIETTGGFGPGKEYITTIALYDGHSVFHYVHGDNLEQFKTDIQRFDLLVTYNGKCFDIPFIRRYFGIPVPQPHIDLMHVLRAVGITGGLKGCERKFGIDRKELNGVDGFFAVLLWREYLRKGDPKALETLLAYNTLDAVNLETLMVSAYNLHLKDTPFAAELALPLPDMPAVPHKADIDTISRMREHYHLHPRHQQRKPAKDSTPVVA